jgi:hypothetical protein
MLRFAIVALVCGGLAAAQPDDVYRDEHQCSEAKTNQTCIQFVPNARAALVCGWCQEKGVCGFFDPCQQDRLYGDSTKGTTIDCLTIQPSVVSCDDWRRDQRIEIIGLVAVFSVAGLCCMIGLCFSHASSRSASDREVNGLRSHVCDVEF